MSWTKEADWLPVTNAISQVRFWKNDLLQAEDELDIVEAQVIRYPTLDLGWLLDEAQEDVNESKEALKKARAKLAKTLKRVNG